MVRLTVKKTVSRGYALGPCYLVTRQDPAPDPAPIREDQAEAEIARFDAAVAKVQAELFELASGNAIFEGHYAIAGDIALREGVVSKIRGQLKNCETALAEAAGEFAMIFENMDDEYMRERAADMRDVAKRILMAEKGLSDDPFGGLSVPSVIIAEDLLPSDTARMDFSKVLGLLTSGGGTTSHVSIIAKNRGIPCLVGIGPEILNTAPGTTVAVCAEEGEIYIDPDGKTLALVREKAEAFAKRAEELIALSELPSVASDGRKISISANAGSVEEVKNAAKYHADGIGLFRSEFLYMGRDRFPTEEEQFEAYRDAALAMNGRELTIRTLDIGGDKALPYFGIPEEDNPFLGWRAIRISLERTDIFKTQLRAVLRASAFGRVRVMFPMVVSPEELEKAKAILEECKAELRASGNAFAEDMETGVMIETPAAVLMADELAKSADFFSIGTNDLTQYILAADRGNPKLSELRDPFHPAVLRAIERTIEEGHRAGIRVGMCGEFASDPKATGILLNMGLDEFSVAPASVPELRARLRELC